jgi:hypothetical protein
MEEFAFDKNDDYKTKFSSYVSFVINKDFEDPAERIKLVQTLTDSYINAIGERPEHRELDELSSWIIFGRKGTSRWRKYRSGGVR